MKHFFFLLPFIFCCLLSCQSADEAKTSVNFQISFSEETEAETLDGRLLLMLSSNEDNEPRFQINDGPSTQVVFGMKSLRLK